MSPHLDHTIVRILLLLLLLLLVLSLRAVWRLHFLNKSYYTSRQFFEKKALGTDHDQQLLLTAESAQYLAGLPSVRDKFEHRAAPVITLS